MKNLWKDVVYYGKKALTGSLGNGLDRKTHETNQYKGKALERDIAKILQDNGFHIAPNLYIPMRNQGEFTEIDLVAVSRRGIFVIEAKNYNATITGNTHDKDWFASYPSGKQFTMYNPTYQNKKHIYHLMTECSWMAKFPVYSVVIFPSTCTLVVEQDKNTNGNEVITIQQLPHLLTRYPNQIDKKYPLKITNYLKGYQNASWIREIQQVRTANKYKKKAKRS